MVHVWRQCGSELTLGSRPLLLQGEPVDPLGMPARCKGLQPHTHAPASRALASVPSLNGCAPSARNRGAVFSGAWEAPSELLLNELMKN